MIMKKRFKKELVKSILGIFFAIMGIITAVAVPFVNTNNAFADPETSETSEADSEAAEKNEDEQESADKENNGSTIKMSNLMAATGNNCKDSLGEVGWLVCPVTEKISEATDWLYEKLRGILEINPVTISDGSPIYEIWKYCLNITNIVFVVFLLVVVYSQITGVGITNYGIKKILPKLIVAAVLVNLSFLICTIAVDISNIVGNGLRGMFDGIEQSVLASSTASSMTTATGDLTEEAKLSYASMYGTLASGALVTVGGVAIAFETGAIWMLIPVVLGAIVAVVSGLITVALRQAVVMLLIMISPLAIVASMLPNTENLFKKWKQLFIKMLVFYPMFSLLFGASSLAGFAIIASATDGFGVLLGTAVQIFPLFFSWSLMKMSGTFLGTINAKMRGLAEKPLATNRAWADSHRQLSKQKHLASGRVYTPSLRLRQFLSDRKVAREEDTADYASTVKNRGLAYNAARKYGKNGVPNKEAEEDYEMQARNMRYTRVIEQHKNNMNKGLGQLEVVKAGATSAQKARLAKLDLANVNAADMLKAERARAEKIEYDNAVGFHKRMEDAINVHMDDKHAAVVGSQYTKHFDDEKKAAEARARYASINRVMEGDELNTQYVAATAAHGYDTQAKIVMSKFQKYFELTPPTRDVRYRLEEFSRFSKKAADGVGFDIKASDNIDAVVSGLRILNQRGDTDFVKDILDDILDGKYGGLKLGSHASQSLASFLMFDVKDNDPYLRRFGKYINLETARMYDKNDRKKDTVDYDEYIKGYHIEPDGSKMYAKKDMVKLMEGTSLDGIERTALDNYDKSLRKAYTDENGVLDLEAYRKKRSEVDKATAPQFISANMKFLSGSEQIASAVKSKTGFYGEQDKTTGEYSMIPVWDNPKEAAELFKSCGDNEEEKAKAKKGLKTWYREQTLQYLRDQTPAQILGLRSDFYVPLIEHLSDAYLYDEDGNEIPERVQELKGMEEAVISQYGSLDSKKAKDALIELKKKPAGEVFRELLYRKGKLRQIEKSKRSGAANNAKDWVRELLLLDSENGLREWIYQREYSAGSGGNITGDGASGSVSGDSSAGAGEKKNNLGTIQPAMKASRPQTPNNPVNQETVRRKAKDEAMKQQNQKQKDEIKKMLDELKKQQKQEADVNLTPAPQSVSVYSVEDIARLTTEIEDIWYNVRDNGIGDEYSDFFEASYDFVMKNLGDASYVATAYEKYYQDNPDGDSYDLREYLIRLLESLLED